MIPVRISFTRRSWRTPGPWLALLALAVFAALYPEAPPKRPLEDPESARVRSIVDGDTIRLEDGTSVRYIGIDTPETRRRVGSRWIKDPMPFSKEAVEANRRLVEGREVKLEQDVQPRDRYGRLLAYVYVDGEMVNERLLKDGLAKLMTIPPNVKHVDRFKAAQREAKDAGRGIWRNLASGEPDS